MTETQISRRALEIERQFRAMDKPANFDLMQERENTKDAHVLTGVPKNVLMEWETIAGTRCIRLRPQNARKDREIIFLHGGAYCLMSAMTHHRFGGHIANAAEADVVIPDYALAPETPFPGARDECRAVVLERLDNGPTNVILAGDSAGGGLALSVACSLRDAKKSLPAALVLMSPWLDLTLSGADFWNDKIDDPILSTGNLSALADLYRGEWDAEHPEVSPLFAELTDLPPLLLQSSGKDLLRDDAARLAARWPEKKALEVQHHAGMLHSFQMFSGDMPEADKAIADIATFLERI